MRSELFLRDADLKSVLRKFAEILHQFRNTNLNDFINDRTPQPPELIANGFWAYNILGSTPEGEIINFTNLDFVDEFIDSLTDGEKDAVKKLEKLRLHIIPKNVEKYMSTEADHIHRHGNVLTSYVVKGEIKEIRWSPIPDELFENDFMPIGPIGYQLPQLVVDRIGKNAKHLYANGDKSLWDLVLSCDTVMKYIQFLPLIIMKF